MKCALVWPAAELQRELRGAWPDLHVSVIASTDSTSTQLVDAARGGDTTPRLLVAEAQSAGRGRQGRTWLSRAGASLTFSFALPLAPRDWSGLSLAAGAALAEAIEPGVAEPRLQLKWPNDLWLCDAPGLWRKLGGVLVETVAAGEVRVAVVGVGLNVTALPHDATLTHGIAWAGELHPGIDAPRLLTRVALPLVQALQRFASDGFAPFAAAYARRDLLAGRPVTTTLAVLPAGTAAGVDADGALLVRHAGGVQRLTSGEVSVRPQGARTPPL